MKIQLKNVIKALNTNKIKITKVIETNSPVVEDDSIELGKKKGVEISLNIHPTGKYVNVSRWDGKYITIGVNHKTIPALMKELKGVLVNPKF